MNRKPISILTIFMSTLLVLGLYGTTNAGGTGVELGDAQIEDLVRRSYQYVAMYNVNNKFALKQGGWNTVVADTKLKDHTMRDIARPNNDTLYIGCMLDLRKDPVILDIPAFDSKYVSLMVTGYDHYVNVPMSVTTGDFKKPEKVLFYTARTKGYDGSPVKGVDRTFEMTGDFVSAIFRVMPHANEKALFKKIIGQMQSVKLITLSEFQGKPVKAIDDVTFPNVGKSDFDVYENNFLEVMQFVVNCTTFDSKNEVDTAFLAALKPLGVEPGKTFDRNKAVGIDGKRFRSIAEKVQKSEFALAMDPAVTAENGLSLFKTKGKITQKLLLMQSVIGPIGLPATEAVYPPVATKDGQPMNEQHDYVIRMTKDQLPPAKAFWSMTLYDSANGFFIPNDRKKYSVGENGGIKLNADGGIDVYVAAEKPKSVPDENWLPINRKDENLDVILRIYMPDLEKFKTWNAPKAEKIK
ncbi:MAG: DUF1214 domain-containing protein [Desulfobacteraceae bacterium]|nr:DUF1214 domain-containing protein [Desulfobacteraceae bacterium]MDH3574279.1 DUF1214 domain-containing protein [Desulfobacteraceae bacterium]MDH3721306.1 DUF1214 domain-containing protein [Desulfobacteraceae bacterium]MDH3836810.1 DUF1214 domain-containing protein [Desulfobacteraceae bacterium]MDH3875714.1 DUF1214 domain-containing protein [Desulfobacteraceae bacterium]